MRRSTVLLLLALPAPVCAQSASEALAAKWGAICFAAPLYSDLYHRCHETLTSPDPGSVLVAARGQRLEEIPGQVRAATRDSTVLPGMAKVELGGGVTARMHEQADGALGFDVEQSLTANWSLFVSADVGRLKRAASVNEAAFSADTWSLTAGADWRPAPGWQLGAAWSHSRDSLDYRDSGGQSDIRFGGLLLFASREIGSDWLVHGYAGELHGGYDLRREIDYRIAGPSGMVAVNGMATASPDARRRLTGIALARAWSRGAWSGQFETGLDWSDTRIDAYSESGGSGLALSVPGRSVDTRRGRFDILTQRTGSQTWGVWQTSLRLGWRQELDVQRRQLSVTLREDIAGNQVRFDTQDTDRRWGEWSLGGALTFNGGHSAFVEYRQRFAHDFLSERLLALGWRVELQ